MNKQLTQFLRNARKNKMLTHEQVAKLSTSLLKENGKAVSRQYYGMIENGARVPSPRVAKAIAQVLDIDWTIFFENDCNPRLQMQAI